MKGQMKVKKLNDTGLYISEMDWDNTYICKENPIGNFVMVIEPLSDFDGGIIYFEKKTDGYLIEDEGYILAGRQNKIRKRVWKWGERICPEEAPCCGISTGSLLSVIIHYLLLLEPECGKEHNCLYVLHK